MNNVSVIRSRSFAHNAKVPWGTFVFLAAVFFIAEQDLCFSLLENFDRPLEFMARAIVEGSLGRRVVFSMLGLFGIVSLMRKGGNRLRINGLLGWLVLFYLMWCFLSLAWADNTGLAFRKLVVLAMLSMGALAVSQRFSLRNIILLAFFATILYLLIGLLAEVILGTFRPLAPGYRFAGTVHPNDQGINCAILFLAAVCLAGSAKRGRKFFLGCALIGLVFLVLTGSRTAFASTLLALFAYGSLTLSLRRKFALILGVVLTFCLLLLLIGEPLFPALRGIALLGREDYPASPRLGNLYTRFATWKECLPYAAKRPILGYGYNSFLTASRATELWATLEREPPHVHSLYLGLLLGIGIIGMISFVLILILGIRSSIDKYKGSLSVGYALFIAIFVFGLLDGLLEPGPTSTGMLSFLTMVALTHLGFTVPRARTSRVSTERGRLCNH